MAGRAVQRALASRESHALRDEEVGRGSTSDTCSEELEDDAKPSRRGNAFDLLLGEGDGEDEDADGTDSSDGQEAKVEARKVVPPQKEPKKKKKKQKQKKKEKDGSGRNKASEGDELDRLLKDLQIVTKEQEEEGGGRRGKTDSDPTTALLGTDNRQLSVEAEMKRIFGAKVVQEGIAEDERNRRMPKGRRRILRKGTIITPKEHWNKFEGGLSMEYLGLEDGRKVFEYKHSVAYQDVQNQYDSLSNTHDPNTLVALLQYHPYHVDTLLTVSELYQHMGEAQVAGELLEKALYALECAWHPYFKPAEGNCRLNFSHEPNKPFFLALFRFAQNLSRRGCHRTSLQCAKLLLALDDDDPLGVLQAIDYYALRAREYRWLLRLSEEYLDGQCTLSLYPNFAFSLSLAKHRIELEAGSSESAGDASDEMLLQAVMLHPAAVKMLIEKLQEKGVARESKWQEVLGRALFKEARHDSASLEHLSRIFVERQHLMWKPEEILSWLRKTADRAANIEEGKEESSFCAGDWQVVCAEFFPPSSVNSYQHLHLGDFSDNRALLPQEDQGAGIFGMGEQAAGNNQPAGAFPMEMLDREDLEEGSPLLMLLRTLLPWVHVGDEVDSPRDPPGPRNGQAAILKHCGSSACQVYGKHRLNVLDEPSHRASEQITYSVPSLHPACLLSAMYLSPVEIADTPAWNSPQLVLLQDTVFLRVAHTTSMHGIAQGGMSTMDAPDSTMHLLHKHLQPNGKVPGSLLIPTLPPHNALGVLARTPRHPLQSVHLSKGFLFPSKTGIHGFLSVPSFSSKGTRKRRNASRGARREFAVAETRGGRLAHLESVLARMWPTMSAWSCALAVAVIAAFANAAGTGGGPLFVPLLGVLLKIDTRDAAALSQSLVFFGSITSTIMHANRKHPLLADRPCLDAGLVLALQPMFMAGVGYGVVVNTTAPNELVCTSLMLVLTMVAAMTMRKGLSMWRKEGREGRTVQYSTYFSSVSGLFADENRIMQADAGVTDPEARIGLPSSPRMETPLLKKDRNGDETTSPAPTESERCVLEEAHASPVASNEPLTPGGVETKSINMDHQRSFLCGCGLIAAASWACFLLIAIVRAAWKHDCGALYWGSLVLELPVALVWEKVALWWVHSPSGTGLTLLNEFLEPNHLVSGDPGGSSSISRRSTPSVIQVYSAADLASIDDSMSRGNVQSGTETLAKLASTSEESVDRLVRVRLQHDPDADADAGEVWTGISVLPLRNKENLGLLPEPTSMHPPVEPHAMLLDEERQRLSRPSELASAETARGDPVPAPISDPEPSIVQGKKQKELGWLPIWALAGGVAAGALGFGGSVVLGPLLLSLNVHPQVTAAVCSAIVFCSSSLAALQYWLAERIAPLEAVGYGLAAMGGSTLGVLWISAAIRRTGRASVTVLLLSALIGSSALVVLIFKFIPAVERGDMRFHPLCGAT